jgi:hypothetical protein
MPKIKLDGKNYKGETPASKRAKPKYTKPGPSVKNALRTLGKYAKTVKRVREVTDIDEFGSWQIYKSMAPLEDAIEIAIQMIAVPGVPEQIVQSSTSKWPIRSLSYVLHHMFFVQEPPKINITHPLIDINMELVAHLLRRAYLRLNSDGRD